MEQHRSVCPLEPVACEMKEFGCSVVVPRRELATHMRESELQHLMAMTALNLRLTRQLQQESADRDRKIERLQLQVRELKDAQKKELVEVKDGIQRVHCISEHIEQHTALCTGYKVLTLGNYNDKRNGVKPTSAYSDQFYSCFPGYAFQLMIRYYLLDIGAFLYLMKGENDGQLQWPVKVKFQLELLNQTGDHYHVGRTKALEWKKDERGSYKIIDNGLMKYTDLKKNEIGVQYVLYDCLKFRVHISVLS